MEILDRYSEGTKFMATEIQFRIGNASSDPARHAVDFRGRRPDRVLAPPDQYLGAVRHRTLDNESHFLFPRRDSTPLPRSDAAVVVGEATAHGHGEALDKPTAARRPRRATPTRFSLFADAVQPIATPKELVPTSEHLQPLEIAMELASPSAT